MAVLTEVQLQDGTVHQFGASDVTWEDISNQITFGSAWTPLIKKAYKCGKMVLFQLEASTPTHIKDYAYTIATIASGYRPSGQFIGNGYVTDYSYYVDGLLSVHFGTDGNIVVSASSNDGEYFFVTGFYMLP